MWTKSSAIHIGTDHIYAKTNRQDTVLTYQDDKITCGVVCDGCSSGENSELGAYLIANLVMKILRNLPPVVSEEILSTMLTMEITHMFSIVTGRIFGWPDAIDGVKEIVNFIENHFLSTFVFCIVRHDKDLEEDNEIIIGQSGDGIIITNGIVNVIDQANSPHYIAYNNVPKDFLAGNGTKLRGIEIEILPEDEVSSIVIASDGLLPLLEMNMGEELFGTKKRQLQRKINVLQNKQKMFHDDISCVVFEKMLEVTEESPA